VRVVCHQLTLLELRKRFVMIWICSIGRRILDRQRDSITTGFQDAPPDAGLRGPGRRSLSTAGLSGGGQHHGIDRYARLRLPSDGSLGPHFPILSVFQPAVLCSATTAICPSRFPALFARPPIPCLFHNVRVLSSSSSPLR